MPRQLLNSARPSTAKVPLEVYAKSEAWAELPQPIKVAVVHVWRAEREFQSGLGTAAAHRQYS